MQIWRFKVISAKTARCRGSLYADIRAGLLPKPVAIGPRAVGIPAHEVEAVMAARVAGRSEDDIRVLVQQLVAARQQPHAATTAAAWR